MSVITVPKLLKVGFQNRTDCYTNKLGFITYKKDEVWSSEKSWEKWRDKSVEILEVPNDWTEGFVLNKKVGGHRWSNRDTYCRVWDPRGFEFEITIDNLILILEHSTSDPGKGLSGKFIYGWIGKRVYLFPEKMPNLQRWVDFFETKTEKLKKSDLVPNEVYLNKFGQNLVFLGEMTLYKWGNNYHDIPQNSYSDKWNDISGVNASERFAFSQKFLVFFNETDNIITTALPTQLICRLGLSNLDISSIIADYNKPIDYWWYLTPLSFENLKLKNPKTVEECSILGMDFYINYNNCIYKIRKYNDFFYIREVHYLDTDNRYIITGTYRLGNKIEPTEFPEQVWTSFDE